MFEATLSEVNIFRKIIDSLKDLVSEVNIEATPTGIIFIIHLNKNFFKEYQIFNDLNI
jgi:hypothetical protein